MLREQQRLNEQDRAYISSLNLAYETSEGDVIPPYLGLSADGWSSYYVGAVWLDKGRRPLIVLPKIERIDYMGILASALHSNVSPSYFQSAYKIDFGAPFIESSTLNAVLSPLIVAHFLSVMHSLVSKGLKRNYIVREENMRNKVRGHIMPLRNLQKNILRGHAEQTWCRFQEYTSDYPENRLLKRGLLAAESLLLSLKEPNNALLPIVRRYLMPFYDISADISPTEVKTIRHDKLHGEYPQAIRLAKLILKRTDNSLSAISDRPSSVPEFTVDMSRIFEFHVLGFLKKKYERVLFQEGAGVMGRCDFIVPSAQLIVDAKYKVNYLDKSRDILRADIREVSGYSRSDRIRKILNVGDNSEIPCLIIYPSNIEEEERIFDKEPIRSTIKPMKGVHNFYTLGISIPLISQK